MGPDTFEIAVGIVDDERRASPVPRMSISAAVTAQSTPRAAPSDVSEKRRSVHTSTMYEASVRLLGMAISHFVARESSSKK